MEEINHQHKIQADWYANFHARNIDNFIGETVGRLEMLATVINSHSSNLQRIEEILAETQQRDSRFSGFYLATTSGELFISTNQLTREVDISDRAYFQKTLLTKNTQISDVHIGRVTGRSIITIATPLLVNDQIQGVLLSSLRLDEIEETINDVAINESITVYDDKGKLIIGTAPTEEVNSNFTSSVKITNLPWLTTATISPDNQHAFLHSLVRNSLLAFVAMNIVFLFIKYFMLKGKVRREKEQTEHQKLELIGNLAASTAHEIRNPLTGIKGLVNLLSEEYKDKKAQFYFEVIQNEVNRINDIVSELLVLGRPSVHTLKIYDANEIMKEIEPIIRSEANYMEIQLDINFTTSPLPIACVKNQLKQVILNLTKNSLHAMKDGGLLKITLQQQNNACLLSVEDNGVGIPREALKQVFNPFFTMKKDGSGIGLTVCKRIIDSYGGTISIESNEGKGTKVDISIPLTLTK